MMQLHDDHILDALCGILNIDTEGKRRLREQVESAGVSSTVKSESKDRQNAATYVLRDWHTHSTLRELTLEEYKTFADAGILNNKKIAVSVPEGLCYAIKATEKDCKAIRDKAAKDKVVELYEEIETICCDYNSVLEVLGYLYSHFQDVLNKKVSDSSNRSLRIRQYFTKEDNQRFDDLIEEAETLASKGYK